jgi:hypothetical protein
MKRYVSAFAVASLALMFTACAQQKKTTGGTAKTTKTTKAIVGVSYISMERTSCFGRCPSYQVEIFRNGIVRYTGRQFTEYTGVYEREIEPKDAQKLMKEFTNYRVDTCKDVYENMIADIPGIIYGFTIDGKEKKIHNAHFGPKYLQVMANKIDAVAKPGIGWRKVGDLPTK